MSKEELKDKVVDMNGEDAGEKTDEIKGTDFVEPKSKLRSALKWVLGGLALLASAAIGGLIGHSIDKNDGDDKTEDNSGTAGSEETTTEG